MPTTNNPPATQSATEPISNPPSQVEDPTITYHRDLEQVIRDCEERAAREAQQRRNQSQPIRPPFGFD